MSVYRKSSLSALFQVFFVNHLLLVSCAHNRKSVERSGPEVLVERNETDVIIIKPNMLVELRRGDVARLWLQGEPYEIVGLNKSSVILRKLNCLAEIGFGLDEVSPFGKIREIDPEKGTVKVFNRVVFNEL
ncbi:hypothetical protein AAFN60_08235 [Roseibacillus persicicus]|uniref:hypothetical protein n=1 Tax=Roseibacillus persicicus TaxID=454148 RepID=UPI00398B346F